MGKNDFTEVFEFEDCASAGDNLEIDALREGVRIQVENPWAGCTETGFGEQTSVTLPKEKIHDLVKWLLFHYPVEETNNDHR